MPVQANVAVNANIVTAVTTAETAVVATQAISYNNPAGQGNALEGNIVAAIGAGTTALRIRCYQGGLAGTLVGDTGNINATASTTASVGFSFLDQTAAAKNSASLSYTISITQVAATGNLTVAAGLGFVNVTPAVGAS